MGLPSRWLLSRLGRVFETIGVAEERGAKSYHRSNKERALKFGKGTRFWSRSSLAMGESLGLRNC